MSSQKFYNAAITFREIFTEVMVRQILANPDKTTITEEDVRAGWELVAKLREKAQRVYDTSKRKDRAPFWMFAYVIHDLLVSGNSVEHVLNMADARLEALVIVRYQQRELIHE